MATNIGTELRRLLKKLGGTPSKYDQTNELLHKITDQVEPGGGGVFLIVDEDNTLNKTWKEIYDAAASGSLPIIQHCNTNTKYVWTVVVENIQKTPDMYNIVANDAGSPYAYSTDSENGYPVHEES